MRPRAVHFNKLNGQPLHINEMGGGIYNLCGIRPKHNNISKGGDYNLCGIEIKIVAMLCFFIWLLICRVCSHPRRISISITNQ
jgi:hypothetical protein